MSSNSIWATLFVTIVGGLVVERCKTGLDGSLNGAAAPNVVVPGVVQTSVVNEYVQERPAPAARVRREEPVAEAVAEISAPEPTAEVPVFEQPAPPPAAYGTISGGTTFRVTVGERVCTHTHGQGATFTGELAQYLAGSNGAGIAPGAAVRFAVQSRRDGDSQEWTIHPLTLSTGGETYQIQASASRYPMKNVSRRRDQAIGALAGAVIGLAGAKAAGASDKEAAVVAVGSGAVGAAAASGSQACLNDSGVIDVTLDAPLLLAAP